MKLRGNFICFREPCTLNTGIVAGSSRRKKLGSGVIRRTLYRIQIGAVQCAEKRGGPRRRNAETNPRIINHKSAVTAHATCAVVVKPLTAIASKTAIKYSELAKQGNCRR